MRTTSPSNSVTDLPPISNSLTSRTFAIVDLPEPESPVKNTANPWRARGGELRRSSRSTAGNVNQAGSSIPCCKRRRCSVPEMSTVFAPAGTASSGK